MLRLVSQEMFYEFVLLRQAWILNELFKTYKVSSKEIYFIGCHLFWEL